MKVQYHDPAKPDMIDEEWRSAKCDAQARIIFKLDPDDPVNVAAGELGGWTDHAIVTVPAEPLEATQLPSVACSEIKLIADRGNTQPIYIGGSAVSSANSQDMEKREVEIVTRVSNANEIYVVAAATHTGQKLRYQTR